MMKTALMGDGILTAGASREAILKSARDLFARKGFRATSIRDIAGDAGVNVAMVYYYFNTKEALHREIIEGAFRTFSELLRDCVDEKLSPQENLYRIIELYIGFFHRNKNLHRIILREIAIRSRHVEEVAAKYISRNFQVIHGVLREGVDRGCFCIDNITLAGCSLVGMIFHYFNAEPLISKLCPCAEGQRVVDILPGHIFRLFLDGVRGPGLPGHAGGGRGE